MMSGVVELEELVVVAAGVVLGEGEGLGEGLYGVGVLLFDGAGVLFVGVIDGSTPFWLLGSFGSSGFGKTVGLFPRFGSMGVPR